uniref:Uncharacterized protein n=1 Tax=Cacopsylla melanoneura TaxID=428564 RepID=A0A8D8TZA5_9HEMI
MKLVSLLLLAVACVMLQFVAPEKIANRSCKFCRDAEFDNDEDADNDQERDSRELGDVSDLGEKFVILLSDNIISHFSDSEKSRANPPKNVCSMDKLVPKFVRCYANETLSPLTSVTMRPTLLILYLSTVAALATAGDHTNIVGKNGTIFSLRSEKERVYEQLPCLNHKVLQRWSELFAKAFDKPHYDNPDTISYFEQYVYDKNFDQVLNYINEIYSIPIEKKNIVKMISTFFSAVGLKPDYRHHDPEDL